MKKRYAAMCALALVGTLSGCGQKQEQPADNTISIAPAAQATASVRAKMPVEYDFSGNNADANSIEIQRYAWDGSAWNKDDYGPFTVGSEKIGTSSGTIRFEPESDAVNSEYIIDVQIEDSRNSITNAVPSKLSGLPTEKLTSDVAVRKDKINDLALDVELPLLVRTFRTDGTQVSLSIDAFSDPENSEALKDSSYAEAYTVKFVRKDNL